MARKIYYCCWSLLTSIEWKGESVAEGEEPVERAECLERKLKYESSVLLKISNHLCVRRR